jgi:maleylpyruvate isomerase
VPSDLDADPAAAIELCQAAHARLVARVEQITDEQVRSPSRLPGWTVAHVLTHLAVTPTDTSGGLRERCGERMYRVTPAGRRSETARLTKGRGGARLTSWPTWTLLSAA